MVMLHLGTYKWVDGKMTNQTFPEDIALQRVNAPGFSFKVPERAHVFLEDEIEIFYTPEGITKPTILKVVVRDSFSDPERACQNTYESIFSPERAKYNKPPEPVDLPIGRVWRGRKWFHDGGKAAQVIDFAHVIINDTVYEFRYHAAPELYEQHTWMLDGVLATLT